MPIGGDCVGMVFGTVMVVVVPLFILVSIFGDNSTMETTVVEEDTGSDSGVAANIFASGLEGMVLTKGSPDSH